MGTKLLIGITGLALFIYLIIHIAGNLLVFFGPTVFNRYAFTLESNPLLIVIELLLLAVFLVHIFKAVNMFFRNQAARPVRYVKKEGADYTSRKSFASSTMIVTGLWLLVFVVIHAKTFRAGWGHEYEWAPGGRDLYRQELETFANPLTVGFYLLTMAVVGSHLWHGIGSAFQSLGLTHPTWTPRILAAGKIIAVLIAGGFMIIAVWAYMQHGGQVHV
ncbi:MAG TPA: succinate dehydrogenase cytochrome b subunit [Vicinamibacterales bacterium]|nr:succinate dehydrogenase cytochrome b subunit [Vicinamibacterales bacterium]